jgi:DNA-binding PadR family transcriptional regulator
MEPMKRNFARCLSPILFLIELYKGRRLSGYDIVKQMRGFGVDISPGTVYPQIRNMERGGLVESILENDVDIYSLTPKGRSIMESYIEVIQEPLQYLLDNLIAKKT